MNQTSFWNIPAAELLQQLQTTSQGLTGEESRRRITQYGPNLLKPKKRATALSLLLSQFKSPIILILIFASALSFFLHNHVDAIIISAIVLVSGLLGFWQEKGAMNAIDKLLSIVQIKAKVMRDGALRDIPVEEIAPDRRYCPGVTFHSHWRKPLWLYPFTNNVSRPHDADCDALYRLGRSGEKDIL
jgi:P-type Mg2+ transporter